ncbi:MAG: hypothetical protein ABEJ79_10980 [Halolamina sp.]
MPQSVRFGLAVAVAAVVAAAVWATGATLAVVGGAFVVYAVATAVVARYPALVTGGEEPNMLSGVFGGTATAGALALLNAVGSGTAFGAGMLGLGLALLGLGVGFALGRQTTRAEG